MKRVVNRRDCVNNKQSRPTPEKKRERKEGRKKERTHLFFYKQHHFRPQPESCLVHLWNNIEYYTPPLQICV